MRSLSLVCLLALTCSCSSPPPAKAGEPTTVFMSGDDEAAKEVVAGLLSSFGHADVLDLGDISTARGTEMYLAFWLRAMGAIGHATFNIRVVR